MRHCSRLWDAAPDCETPSMAVRHGPWLWDATLTVRHYPWQCDITSDCETAPLNVSCHPWLWDTRKEWCRTLLWDFRKERRHTWLWDTRKERHHPDCETVSLTVRRCSDCEMPPWLWYTTPESVALPLTVRHYPWNEDTAHDCEMSPLTVRRPWLWDAAPNLTVRHCHWLCGVVSLLIWGVV